MAKSKISEMDNFQNTIWKNKYQYEDETMEEWLDRVSNSDEELKKIIMDKKFLFGGRILANRGLQHKGKKVTYSNCYVLSQPEDNIESIFDTAKSLARTFSYGGGVGIDISKLRPKGSKVNNAAVTTTGSISFMDLYNMTTDIIGQKGRRGALMMSMDVNHPDIEEFIDIKTNLEKITKANLSVRVDDKFMRAVLNDELHKAMFVCEDTGEKIVKLVNAKKIFMKLVANNYNFAEPGLLFWDTIEKNNFLSEDPNFKYEGVNPCAEEPLPAGGSCLLGAINLSEFVTNAFTPFARFDTLEFKRVIRLSVNALNDVLDEGLGLHPLKEQRESVSEYRQIGLGVMGIADMLIKFQYEYGSPESIELCNKIASTLLNESVIASSLLAHQKGTFSKFNLEAIQRSNMYSKLDDIAKRYIDGCGLRNSQLLTIPPTGSISNLIGVSGGIEPIYSVSYTRKTESLHDEDVYYKVFTPIVEECIEANEITDSDSLPYYIVTAMDLEPERRLEMQSIWQNYIDASISSTINLPNEASVKDIYNIYIKAWELGLKGVTIYRDGCKREGILSIDKKVDKVEVKTKEKEVEEEIIHYETKCTECGESIIANTGGCYFCLNCGHGGC